MGTPNAQFPGEIWDGDTHNVDREGRSNEPEPNNQDWDRIVSEVIAAQTEAATHQGQLDAHENLFRIPNLTILQWEKNQKASLNSLGGGLTVLATGSTINTGNTINVTKNPSKLLIVVNSAETMGTITVTGNQYSLLTGNLTANYTEDIVVTTNTTDNSANTANNGTMKWDMTNAYVTDEIYYGDVVLSTTDLAASDVDVYSIWYFQNPQIEKMTLDAVTLAAQPSNNSAALDIIVYAMLTERAEKTLNIIPSAHIEVDGTIPVVDPNGMYALQRVGFVGESYPSLYDGIFTDVTFHPASQTYWESVVISLWASFYFAQTPAFG